PPPAAQESFGPARPRRPLRRASGGVGYTLRVKVSVVEDDKRLAGSRPTAEPAAAGAAGRLP
ncbi:MAG: hypothetical protein ACRDYY_03530, partial [Acidimicrobiales bacterium]